MKSSLCSFLESVLRFLSYTSIRDTLFSDTLNLRVRSRFPYPYKIASGSIRAQGTSITFEPKKAGRYSYPYIKLHFTLERSIYIKVNINCHFETDARI
jgi:hypothetical protein